MRRGYVIVEGHGEASGSVVNLLTRLWTELGLTPGIHWAPAIRAPGIDNDAVLKRSCESVRLRPDAGLLLILRDEDDGCPRDLAPRQAALIRGLHLPFPTAIVLAEREYEALFLASLPSLAGKGLKVGAVERPGIRADAVFSGRAHQIRGAKEWLTANMSQTQRRVRYKPHADQLALTRMVDFHEVRRHDLPWFGTLERALGFLNQHLGGTGGVYPDAAAA